MVPQELSPGAIRDKPHACGNNTHGIPVSVAFVHIPPSHDDLRRVAATPTSAFELLQIAPKLIDGALL